MRAYYRTPPSLRVCALINVPMAMLPHSSAELPALETFDYTQSVASLPSIQDVLGRFTNVRELTIGCQNFYGQILDDLLLPELYSLAFFGLLADALLARFLERIKMPKLSELAVAMCAPQRLAPELKALSAQLRRVRWLYRHIHATDVRALAALVNLTSISFTSCTLPGVLMDRLSESDRHADIMWPRLSYMKLKDTDIKNVAETRSFREVALVRNAPLSVNKKENGQPRWSGLVFDIRGDVNIPEEQFEEVREYLVQGDLACS